MPSFALRAPALAGFLIVGCAGSASTTDSHPAGGPARGALDAHCTSPGGGLVVQPTHAAACQGSAMPTDAGAASYGETRFNADGQDDDCKYHLSWSATPIALGNDVTFSLQVADAATGAPVTGAGVNAELFLSDTHPAPNTAVRNAEPSPGRYTMGPLRFDAPGRWTVRFHLFESCSDAAPDSPHAHGAFFVDVP
jgi:hypothetical protein